MIAVSEDEVGIVLLDHVQNAQRPLVGIPLRVSFVSREDAFGRRPLEVIRTLVFPQIDPVEQARIVSLPPFSFAIGKGEISVVGHAFFRAL